MANTKKNTVKKSVTKTAARRVPKLRPIPTKDEAAASFEGERMWIVSERKILTWTPIAVFPSEDQARLYARVMDDVSGVTFNKFKVDGAGFLTHAFVEVTEGDIVAVNPHVNVNG